MLIVIKRRVTMKATEGKIGRVFILRLEDGDMLPMCIEKFAWDNNISVGQVIMVGGIGGGQVVVGPRNSDEMPPEAMLLPLDGAHEVVSAGSIFPDENGNPAVHMHAALGRAGKTTTGCLRPGVNTWLVGEVFIYEILGTTAVRAMDKKSGFELLDV
jgi:predicted DNA-binding protein with PD1-like motif